MAGRRFAFQMQKNALESALAAWPRRASTLLEVNCGNGAFLHFLWQCGFDVEACEKDYDLRQKAWRRNIPGLQIHAAQDSDLPFENDAFDWIIIHIKNGEESSLKACANEGARLARRGFLFTFWNSNSIAAFFWRIAHKKKWADYSAPWSNVWRTLHAMKIGRISTFSTLNLPMCFWRHKWNPLGVTNWPIGAWCIIRIDIGPTPPLTALPLRIENPLTRSEPALEPFSNEIAGYDSVSSTKSGQESMREFKV